MAMSRGLADTSLFIANESGRPLQTGLLPDELAVSAITLGELRAGVLAAGDIETRYQRLSTLTAALALQPIPIDDEVASAWARLRLVLRDQKLKLPVNDSWIAATAISLGVPVVTQDDDFPILDELDVIRI